MITGNTDVEWEKWGREDPYFGVLTNEKYRFKNLSDEAKENFFESGRAHVSSVLAVIRHYFDPKFSPAKILDFGCGVGRLVVPFCEIAEMVTGLDVSESMLKEAEKNCYKYRLKNTQLLKSDDELSLLDGNFDLIHSFIVFQHIPVDRGMQIFSRLLDHLEKGGICAVQFIYSHSNLKKNYQYPPVPKVSIRTKLAHLIKMRRSYIFDRDPSMQMNLYNLDEIFFVVYSRGISNIYAEFTNHDGVLGCFLYFQKPHNS